MAIRDQFQRFVNATTNATAQASIGKIESDGSWTTDAPGGDGYVFVTYGGIDGFGGGVSIARNFAGSVPKLPVEIKERRGVPRVVDADESKLPAFNGGDNTFKYITAKHTHAIGGGMVDPVEGLRFVPGLVRTVKVGGSYGLNVYIEPFFYELDRALVYWPGRVFDLTSYVPGTANKKAWVVIGIDPTDNTATATTGTEYPLAFTMSPSLLDAFDFSDMIPLGAVVLSNGQTVINNTADFADLRIYANGGSGTYPAEIDWWHIMSSALRLWGGEISDNGDGTVDVSAGQGLIKADEANYETRPTAFLDGQASRVSIVSWADTASIALTDDALNHIYYDGSADVITATNVYSDISDTRDFIIGHAWRDGTTLYAHGAGLDAWNWFRRLQHFGEEYLTIILANGGAVAETGARYLTVTAASVFFEIMREYNLSAFDTSGADTFTYWYRDGAGGWTASGAQTQIDNTNYDDNSGAPTALTVNRYGAHWIYLTVDDSLQVVYGQGDYTLVQAQAAGPPASLPGPISSFGVLIAKILVQKSAANLYSIEAPSTTMFSLSAVSDHGNLSGLADDDHTQYALDTHSFVTVSAEARLTAERVLTAGTGISLADGGAGSTATIGLNITGLTEDTTPDTANDLLVTYDNDAATYKKVKPDNLGIGGATLTYDSYEPDEASNYFTNSTSFEAVDSGGNLELGITTHGNAVLIHFHGSVRVNDAAASNRAFFNVYVDGSSLLVADDGICVNAAPAGAGINVLVTMTFTRLVTGLSAGAHTFELYWKSRTTEGANIYAGAGTAESDVHPQFWVMEIS